MKDVVNEAKIEEKKEEIKAKTSEIVGDVKEKTEAVKRSILGEDGKFDKEDVNRIKDDVKTSKVGQAVLGEDGKFDKEDVERLAEGAKDTVKGVVDKVKNIFEK